MHICDIILRISSTDGALNEIPRYNVTPAEVVLLREIKGENAVRFNGNLRDVNRSNPVEINRLQGAYGATFLKLFPGRTPFLPRTFNDVDLDTSRIMELTPYVPAPDEATDTEVFTSLEEVETVAVTEVKTLVPTAQLAKPKRRTTKKKPAEDFSAE